MKDKHVKTEKVFPIPKVNEYLISEELSTVKKRLLFKLRIFNAHRDIQCDLCNEEYSEENQTHLLQCSFLLNHPKLESISIQKIEENTRGIFSQRFQVDIFHCVWGTVASGLSY